MLELTAGDNGHETGPASEPRHARSVRPVASRQIFTLSGRFRAPSARTRFSPFRVTQSDLCAGSEGHAIRVGRVVVVVDVAVVVHIREVGRVRRIRRTEPPVRRREQNNMKCSPKPMVAPLARQVLVPLFVRFHEGLQKAELLLDQAHPLHDDALLDGEHLVGGGYL